MTKIEQTRLSSWRLKVLQQAATGSRNVARTCRHVGISRRVFYKWKQRFDEHGEAGLCDRSRAPHRSPRELRRRSFARSCTFGSIIILALARLATT
jgi:transposase-like protein